MKRRELATAVSTLYWFNQKAARRVDQIRFVLFSFTLEIWTTLIVNCEFIYKVSSWIYNLLPNNPEVVIENFYPWYSTFNYLWKFIFQNFYSRLKMILLRPLCCNYLRCIFSIKSSKIFSRFNLSSTVFRKLSSKVKKSKNISIRDLRYAIWSLTGAYKILSRQHTIS